MNKFRFRLQRVMDAKEGEERQRQRELGEALEALRAEEEKLRSLYEEVAEVTSLQRSLVGGRVSAADMVLYDRWQRSLQTKIRQQKLEVSEKSQEVEHRRGVLLEVSRERKVLENLKEKRLEEHNYQVRIEQQNTLDDIGAKLWAQQRDEERRQRGNRAGGPR